MRTDVDHVLLTRFNLPSEGAESTVRAIGEDPAWLQMIHGTNVSNRVRGRRIKATPYEATFGALLDGVGDPRPAAVTRDFLVNRPGRSARDLGRTMLKRAALAVMGNDCVDRLKAEWTSHQLQRNWIPK